MLQTLYGLKLIQILFLWEVCLGRRGLLFLGELVDLGLQLLYSFLQVWQLRELEVLLDELVVLLLEGHSILVLGGDILFQLRDTLLRGLELLHQDMDLLALLLELKIASRFLISPTLNQ